MQNRTIILLLTALTLYCVFPSNAFANNPYLPNLALVDSDRQQLFLLERQTIQTQATRLFRYRLLRKDIHTDNFRVIDQLGTQHQALPLHISGMAWDPLHQRIIFADAHARSIFALQPSTQQREEIINHATTSDYQFGDLGGLAVDSSTRRILLIDKKAIDVDTQRILTQIELDTGIRSSLFTTNTATAKKMGALAITFDPVKNLVYLAYNTGIMAIDPNTQQYDVLTDHGLGIGQGPSISRSAALAFDTGNHRLIVADPLVKQLMGVDPTTGTRQVIAAAMPTKQNELCWPAALAITDDSVIIADEGHGNWLQLNATTQALAPIAANSTSLDSKCINTAAKPKPNIFTRILKPRKIQRPTWSKLLPSKPTSSQANASPVTALNRFEYLVIAFWNTAFVSVLIVSGIFLVVLPLWLITESMQSIASKPRNLFRIISYIMLLGLGGFFLFLTIPVITGSVLAANFLTLLYTPIAFIFSSIIALIF